MLDFDQQNQGENPQTGASEVKSGDARKSGNDVGYKRPPLHTRFKPGQSGNPNRRPVGRANAKSVVSEAINKKVSVRQGQKTRTVPLLGAVVEAHLAKAAKGDARSAQFVIGLAGRLGLLGEQEHDLIPAPPQEDRAIVQEFLRRNQSTSEDSVEEE
jgi:Family of unknown function (DUF5681)